MNRGLLPPLSPPPKEGKDSPKFPGSFSLLPSFSIGCATAEKAKESFVFTGPECPFRLPSPSFSFP